MKALRAGDGRWEIGDGGLRLGRRGTVAGCVDHPCGMQADFGRGEGGALVVWKSACNEGPAWGEDLVIKPKSWCEGSNPWLKRERMTAAVLPAAHFMNATLEEAAMFVRVKAGEVTGTANGPPILVAPLLAGESYGLITLDLKNITASTILAASAKQAHAEMICLGDALYLVPQGERHAAAGSMAAVSAAAVLAPQAAGPRQLPSRSPTVAARARQMPSLGQDLKTPELQAVTPPKDASEAELRRYARGVMLYSRYLHEHRGGDKVGGEEQLALLTGLGADNLDLIIDECTKIVREHKGLHIDNFTFSKAVEALVTDQDKALIIQCFQDNIRLIRVIDLHHWEEDAAPALAWHAAHYSLGWNGYSGTEVTFVRTCLKSKSPAVTDAVAALVADPKYEILDAVLNVANAKDYNPQALKTVWASVSKSQHVSFQMAALAAAVGDLTALEAMARNLLKFQDMDLPSDEEGERYLARVCGNALLSVTGAPQGKAGQAAQWVLDRIGKLAWDEGAGKFLERP